VGTFNFSKPWVYTFFAATNAFDRGFDTETTDSFAIYDYRLDIPLWKRATLSLGKQKEPISMERLMGMTYEPMQERSSVSDAMLPSRNVGVVLNSTLPGDRLSFAAGVFNDWFDAGEKLDEAATQVVGRVTGLPFLSEDEGSLLHLGFGLRYTDAELGLRFRTEPEFNQAPDFVDTGIFEAASALAYSGELSVRRGPVWLAGEYVRTNARAPALGDPGFWGYHVTASWVVSGEVRAYHKQNGTFRPVPVAKPVNQGGWGAWELAARWSHLDLTDGAVDGGKMKILSLGLNWWLTPVFSFNVNYRHIILGRFGLTGRADGLTFRIALMLE
jgi:phosphate-selective porin OprO/OprP